MRYIPGLVMGLLIGVALCGLACEQCNLTVRWQSPIVIEGGCEPCPPAPKCETPAPAQPAPRCEPPPKPPKKIAPPKSGGC